MAKLLLTVCYILTVQSFGKYQLSGLFVMLLFPVLFYQFAYLRISTCFYKLRMVMPLVCLVGVANPFFDREILYSAGTWNISGGVVSMVALALKGVLCLMMTFLFASTTPAEEICAALRMLHVPRTITSLFLLTVRYSHVLLEQFEIMTESYALRAPGQKGIRINAWGSFLGQLLLRSMDRARELYDAMCLRGYSGNFYYMEKKASLWKSLVAAAILGILMVLARIYNLTALL